VATDSNLKFKWVNGYAGCLQLLEILEISWNLIGPPRNFCVRCRRSTPLVSSHKIWINIRCKNTKFIAIRCVFSSSRCTKTHFRPGLRPGRLWGSLWHSRRFLFGWRELKYPYYGYFRLWVFQLSEGGRSKANMSWIFLKIPPGISWKSPGNLLD